MLSALVAIVTVCATTIVFSMGMFGKKRSFVGKHAFITG